VAGTGDFAFGRFNLGNLEMKLGNLALAEKHYTAAIAIDDLFYPAKANLAFLYNGMGRNEAAETLFRQILRAYPERYDIAYNLGLLLAEMGQFGESAVYLERAAVGFGTHGRAYYNLGLVFQTLGRDTEAEHALLQALEIEPGNGDYLYAAADHFLKRKQYRQARQIAERALRELPSSPLGRQLLELLDQLSKP
jgi:Tfp pilus assembly protein PilF